MSEPWPTPSPRVADLLRQGAQIALNPRAEWIEDLHAAALSGSRMRAIAEDPVLREGVRRTNLANLLHWASANAQHPGRRVRPHIGPEALENSRDLVRRGLDAGALDSYRTAQNAAWRRWMEICFELTGDPDELHELLDVSSHSISAFLDDTVAAISEQMDAERHELVRGTHAERRAAVALLLEGAPITRARAEAQLGYPLTGSHTAAVVWTSEHASMDQLESVAEHLVRASDARRRLTVVAGAGTLWVWLPVARAPRSAAYLAEYPEIRVAVGRPGRDIDGFRGSHLDALTAQRMLARLTSPQQYARYEDVQMVALLTTDPAQADEFVTDTLGDLEHADREILDVVRAYVREQCNTSRTAERLYSHRNTVIRRLARADELLPRPLAENLVAVAAALDLLKWRQAKS